MGEAVAEAQLCSISTRMKQMRSVSTSCFELVVVTVLGVAAVHHMGLEESFDCDFLAVALVRTALEAVFVAAVSAAVVPVFVVAVADFVS